MDEVLETVMASTPAARHASVSDSGLSDPSPSADAFEALSMAIAGADAAVSDSLVFTAASDPAIGSMTSPLSAMQVVQCTAHCVLARGRGLRQIWFFLFAGFE